MPGLATDQTVTFVMSNPQKTPSLLFAPKENTKAKQSLNSVNVSKCTVTAQSPNCTISSATEGANNGSYIANIVYEMANPTATGSLNPINYTIVGGNPTPPGPTPGPTPVYGTISMTLSTESPLLGKSTTITYTLENSQYVTTPVTIIATSSAESVLDSSLPSCEVTTANPTCTITESGLSLGTAIISSNAGVNYTIADSNEITVKIPLAYAYVTNAGTVSLCYVDDEFNLYNCADTGSGFETPSGVSVAGSFAYITNSANSTVSKCSIDPSNGMLSSCASTGNNFAAPIGIATDVFFGYAYVTDVGTNTINTCIIDAGNGNLNNCTSALPPGLLNQPTGISLDRFDYAYIANRGNNAVFCNVSSGNLSRCGLSTDTATANMSGVSATGKYVYFTSPENSLVEGCKNNGPGQLGTCSQAGSFTSPTGIYALGDTLGDVVYVTDDTDNSVSVCKSDNSTGQLSDCKTTGNDFRQPSSIVAKYNREK